jgi:GNAT superfamily N-acetyltransferase
MNSKIEIRKFQPLDARDCFRIRASAFIKLFYDEIGSEAVTRGINAYMPGDFIQISENLPMFVAFENQSLVGFIAARSIEQSKIEILFLYVRLDTLGKGIGTMLAKHFESWVGQHASAVQQIVVDTAVPKYNQKFYERLGYAEVGDSECNYPAGSIRAVRLAKNLS